MVLNSNFKELSFLVYGLGITGKSVVKFFKRKKIKKYQVWDDKNKKLFANKRPLNLEESLERVNYIILSPGISLNKSIHKKKLIKYKSKIITDIDLIYLFYKNFKSIVVTGTNGKSTTCKIINHLLKKNQIQSLLGGNIGTPVLNLKVKKNIFLIIEASSFQLAYSQFIHPNYAFLLNISNDHLDWHGSKNHYKNSKFKIFNLQKKNNYAFVNYQLKENFKRKNFLSKLIIPKSNNYKKLKKKIKNIYIKSNINDENMSNVLSLSKLLKISDKSFIKSMETFVGLPHRYETFLKRKEITFINDSKATSFQATKFALENSSNIFWILGGLPKKNDKVIINDLKKNIAKVYIIGKHIKFFEKQIKGKVNYSVTKNLKNSIIRVLKDIKKFNIKKNTILLSPSAASYDQYLNFEKRGEEFKKLSKFYARKYI